ncbi:hypothetical protein GN958_ATG05727 [Phytophthora infestans]|uniref:Uncharacterized protein n=1 Tax=Phytophthora infestans TaxID=4787 RepID=A0A8S9UWH2_PHYIN|nr:hypothetical protein GN958_ATG05727 [Phytophthora infestans]
MQAAHTQLDEELEGRDEGRARRYVATVRPTKAALRYIRPASVSNDGSSNNVDGPRGGGGGDGNEARGDVVGGEDPETEEGGAHSKNDEVMRSEEGGEWPENNEVARSEEGGDAKSDGHAVVSSNDVAMATENVIQVRKAARRAKSEAKRKRVEAAKRKSNQADAKVDVNVTLAALDAERQVRREQQSLERAYDDRTGTAKVPEYDWCRSL